MSSAPASPPTRKVTLFCPFGGGGGSALGGQQARAQLFGRAAAVELLGGIDNIEGRCVDFEYLTGVPQWCRDVHALTAPELREHVGPRAPDIVFSSPPCKSSSGLLPKKRLKEAKYEKMSRLALDITRLLLDAWETPPPILVYENVPRITSRAAKMLAEIRALLRARGYIIQDGYHDCGEVGGLGQRRRRWFFVARHAPQVPFFLYRPPRKKVRPCGDVLRMLPMPGDPAGGPMHRLPAQSAKNDARLTAIPPGGDWRDLVKDAKPRRARFRRQHMERWTDPSITVAGPGSNGPCGVADPRTPPPPIEAYGYIVPLTEEEAAAPLDLATRDTAFRGRYGVLDPQGPSGVVTGNARPPTGPFAVADGFSIEGFAGGWGVLDAQRPAGAVIGQSYPSNGRFAVADDWAFGHVHRVTPWTEPIGTITRSPAPSSGAAAVADPRIGSTFCMKVGADAHTNHYVVLPSDAPARCVTSATRPGNGGLSIADPRLRPQAGNDDMHWGKYVVLDPTAPAHTVTGASRVGSGAQSIADPSLLLRKPAYDHAYMVLPLSQPSYTIATKTSVGCGAYAVADDLLIRSEPRAGSYGVLDAGQPARTVVGAMRVDNSPAAVAAPLPANLTGYGILPWPEARRIISGEVRAPFAVFDSRFPGGPPAAIVDDFDRPAFVWVHVPSKNKRGKGRWKKCAVPLVMVAEDGTWHRPLTTLELAALQGLFWLHRRGPLCFVGGSTEQRETIGNMVPPPAAQAIVEQMLLALLAADAGCFYLDSGGEGVWCRPEDRKRLERAGVLLVQGRRPWVIGGKRILDDGAVIEAKPRARRAKVQAKRTAQPRPLAMAAVQ